VYIIIGIKKILKQTEKHLSQSSLDSGLENSGKNHENNNNPDPYWESSVTIGDDSSERLSREVEALEDLTERFPGEVKAS